MKNVHKLNKIQLTLEEMKCLDEETKEQKPNNVHAPQFQEDDVYKTLFGHQEVCLGMQLSDDGKYIVSVDTLKKINVSHFPNVFNLQSVFQEHTRPISHFILMNDN